ncbi:MAG: hypothetical protein JXR48_02445 [Candidatus Delongbacteria bacterium]|nr:hypothetical protein [Candidatus Delongbacteria bacterium]MBN2833806.1 hypothetical protein [Candidatus Delongbacteria bacterium]
MLLFFIKVLFFFMIIYVAFKIGRFSKKIENIRSNIKNKSNDTIENADYEEIKD